MKELQVKIELSGENRVVGRLFYNSSLDAVFKYDSFYMKDKSSVPISLSLSFQQEPFTPWQTKRFFEGLLPEGYTRRTVAQWLQVAENDYISILHGLGRECLGAIQIVDNDSAEGKTYTKLTLEEIKQLANEGTEKSTEIIIATHLSLAGASGKVGLYKDRNTGDWYLPKGLAPSTHIVKQSHVRLKSLVANEQLALLTAKKLGINVANSFIIDTGEKQDADVLLASERYDRTFAGTTTFVDGLACPLRLHQEDFSQAMGIGAGDKYEKAGQQYLKKMFDVLYKNSAKPLADAEELWRRIVFNYLIGNCDGHIKNSALLYSSNMQSIRLAPAYDIVSTVIYKPFKHNMSIYIAGECDLDKISRETFATAAKEVGIGQRKAIRVFEDLAGSFKKALTESAATLSTDGFTNMEFICNDIIKYGGISHL